MLGQRDGWYDGRNVFTGRDFITALCLTVLRYFFLYTLERNIFVMNNIIVCLSSKVEIIYIFVFISPIYPLQAFTHAILIYKTIIHLLSS